jgi:CheY-like chemotaxis protein
MVAMPHKLLLADDSVTIQRVIELTFADEDVQVTAVGNGQAAIESVQRDPPDIVLADVGMPERNGYEVAAFIKGTPAFAHIPVVLLTGAFEPVDEARARSVGCNGVLVKPFEPQIVISRVKDLLAGRQPSGMWGSGPVAQGPVRPAAPAASEGHPPGGRSTGDPLEAYFDHLDQAFNPGTPATDPGAQAPPRRDPIPVSRMPPATAQPVPARIGSDPFADWDPDLIGDPTRPGPLDAPLAFTSRTPGAVAPTPEPAAPAPPRDAAPAPIPVPAPAAPPPAPRAAPSLVDAFAALLAAEQTIGLAPSAATTALTAPAAAAAPAAPAITEELIETVTARVVARLTDQSRHVVLDAAERLVREEIDRIRQTSGIS